MPFALVLIGLMLIVAGARDTQTQLATQLSNDFTGQNSFLYWIAGIGVVGTLGYVPKLQTFSRVAMALILIVLILSNGGFFQQFLAAIQNPAPYTPNSFAVAGSASGQPVTQQNAGTLAGAAAIVNNPGGVASQVAGQVAGQMGGFFMQGITNTLGIFGF